MRREIEEARERLDEDEPRSDLDADDLLVDEAAAAPGSDESDEAAAGDDEAATD
jgi:hypothetical protein